MTIIPIPKMYEGSVHIDFLGSLPLRVVIETDRLIMRSAEEFDKHEYLKLYADPSVMGTYDSGEPETEESVLRRIHKWVNRWNERDPYSGFAILDKITKQFIGHLVLGHGSAPGESEYACLFHKSVWGQGIATEATTAIFHHYAPRTIEKGYTLEGKALERIVVLIRPENAASFGLLKKETFLEEAEREGKRCFVFKVKTS